MLTSSQFTLFLNELMILGLTLTDWIQAERWPLIPIVSAANIYSLSKSTQKKLVLMLADPGEIIENLDKNSESGK